VLEVTSDLAALDEAQADRRSGEFVSPAATAMRAN